MKDKIVSSSPTGILEDYFRSSGSESTSSEDHPKPPSFWRGFFKLLRSKSTKPVSKSKLHPLSVLNLSKRLSNSMRETLHLHFRFDSNLANFNSPWKNFTLRELQAATNYFSPDNLIGKGGYAEVYRGCLKNGQVVAIKRLTRGKFDENIGDFLLELGIMAHVNHPNTAKLIGYGIEGGMHLVLDFSPRGSLASRLYGLKEKLEWNIRYKIAIGTAKGLRYLHEGCQRRIIHRDIKAANILLTEDFEPQAKPLLKKNNLRELVDPFITNYNSRQMNFVLLAASLCIQQSSIRRPCMRQVVMILTGDLSYIRGTRKIQIPFLRKAFCEELMRAEQPRLRDVLMEHL